MDAAASKLTFSQVPGQEEGIKLSLVQSQESSQWASLVLLGHVTIPEPVLIARAV